MIYVYMHIDIHTGLRGGAGGSDSCGDSCGDSTLRHSTATTHCNNTLQQDVGLRSGASGRDKCGDRGYVLDFSWGRCGGTSVGGSGIHANHRAHMTLTNTHDLCNTCDTHT